MIPALFLRYMLLLTVSHAPASHVAAAVSAETLQVRASLLVAQAWYETKWTTNGVSRVFQGKRGPGRAMGKFPSSWSGPYFCGPSQIKRTTEAGCRSITIPSNYLEARANLEYWLERCKKHKGKTKISHEWLDCAMAGYGGYGGGNAAITFKGKAWRYGLRTQRLGQTYEDAIRRLLQ